MYLRIKTHWRKQIGKRSRVRHLYQAEGGGGGDRGVQETQRETLTTLPARPPAIKAKLINKNSLALQTAFESPNPSSPRTRSLSIRLTTSMPRREQIPGIQSTNVTCTSTGSVSCGGLACAERIAASRNVQLARVNYTPHGVHETHEAHARQQFHKITAIRSVPQDHSRMYA